MSEEYDCDIGGLDERMVGGTFFFFFFFFFENTKGRLF